MRRHFSLMIVTTLGSGWIATWVEAAAPMFRSDMARIVPTPWLPLRDPWLDDAELDLDAMLQKYGWAPLVPALAALPILVDER